MPISGKKMVMKMKAIGWTVDRIEGSHYIMQKDSKTVVVPVHGNRDLKQGTESRIRKEIGLKK